MKETTLGLALAAIGLLSQPMPARAADASARSPNALANVYQSIADSVLAAKNSESAIVRAILQHERDMAVAALDKAASSSGGAADLRTASAHIGNFATEGGAAIEPIRNKLLQGGHHHHADDTGPTAVYDEGYVVLTKKLKQEALDLAKRCGKAGEAAKVDAKEAASIREALNALATRALATK